MVNTNLQPYATWTFLKPCDVPFDVEQHVLLPEEKAICAYKTTRDVAVLTDKRIIVRDEKGLTGKKVEMTTIPYSSVILYSTETAGGFMDVTAEIGMWTMIGYIKIELDSDIDIREFDRMLAGCILNK